MMIRPSELRSIKDGEIDLAFRRWERPRVVVGTKMRTGVGLLEVTSVTRWTWRTLTDEDARRAGSPSLAALVAALEPKADRPAWRVGLRHAGSRPAGAAARRRARPRRRSPRSSRGSSASTGPRRTAPGRRQTLDLIDRNPERRAPDLAAKAGRETADFKKDVRKLKELGLTESLAIGYRLSPRGEVVVDKLRGRGAARVRRARRARRSRASIGAPATRALRAAGLTSLESLGAVTEAEVSALHGVGPIAIARLREALATRAWATGLLEQQLVEPACGPAAGRPRPSRRGRRPTTPTPSTPRRWSARGTAPRRGRAASARPPSGPRRGRP